VSAKRHNVAVDLLSAARTRITCATQRADNIAAMIPDTSNVDIIELCVGPSLATLRAAYQRLGFKTCVGNDVDVRWSKLMPKEAWLLGDALEVFVRTHDNFGVTVFGPPLTRKCRGTRNDALMIDDVTPRYEDFIAALRSTSYMGLSCIVLPARCRSTKQDRSQLHALLCTIETNFDLEVVDLIDGCRKYVDVYMRLRSST
jgi:hypothetical protein